MAWENTKYASIPTLEVGLLMLILLVVYILPVWLWLPARPPIRSRIWTRGSSTAARIRILRYVLQFFLSALLTDGFLDPELGNIFSAFGSGLCAGVTIYQTMLF